MLVASIIYRYLGVYVNVDAYISSLANIMQL